ncbi:phospholipid transport system substrate-binding protein [Gammaproteobacteria bacterium]
MTLRPFVLCFMMSFSVSTTLLAEESKSTLPPPATHEETSAPREAVAPSPEAILRNGITALTEQFKRGGKQEEMLAFLDREIARHFDFGYMARLSAGYYWNNLNEEQRHTFEDYFRYNFFQSLARQVSNLGNPQIQFYPPRPGTSANEMTVSARVTQPQGIPILMDFRFYRNDQGWKVFDVVADGSSAVLYYRHFYADLVSRYGVNALLGANKTTPPSAGQ